MSPFETCFKSSAVMLLLDFKSGAIVKANEAAIKFYGYTYDELCGMNISDITVYNSGVNLLNFNLKEVSSQHRIKDSSIRDIKIYNSIIQYDYKEINWAIIQDVSEEIRLKNKLKIFFRIVDDSDAMISISDMDRKITFLNKKMRKTYSIAEKANLSNFEIQDFYTNKGKIVSKINISETKKRDFWKGENEMQNFDGTKIHVIQSGIVIKDITGSPEFTCITSIDISEKIEGELNSIKSEELFKSLFDTMNGFAYCKIIYDKLKASDLEYIKVNKAFELQIGYKNIVGKRLSEIAPTFLEKEINLFSRCAYVANSGVSEIFETYAESVGLWLSISIQSLAKDHFILSFEVINDRKEKEKLIEGLLYRYHSLLEIASDGIHVLDKKGKIIEANESFCKMLGYSKNEIQLLNISDWDINWPKEELLKRISETISLKSIFQTKHIRKDGTVIDVEINATGIHLDNKDYLYASARDITLRKENEKKIIESNFQLKKLNADLESFAFIASHDLKAPLNNVNGFLKLLNNKKEILSEDNKEVYLKYIQKSIDQMNILTTELLQYSRMGNNKDEFSKVNINEVMNSLKLTLAEPIQYNNAYICYTELPTIFANKTLIHELFMNLLNNALKYHDNKKQLEIEIGYTEQVNTHQFYIRDNGLGIASENLEKIFIMFKRLHTQSEYMGTGIGLALCKRIVESHEGKIWVESELGKGSAFYFTIRKLEQEI